MVETDLAILELMESLRSDSHSEIAVSPMVVYINLAVLNDITSKGSGTIARRMRLMSDGEIGLIEKVSDVEGTYYTLTPLARDFLQDDHDPAQLVPPEDFGKGT